MYYGIATGWTGVETSIPLFLEIDAPVINLWGDKAYHFPTSIPEWPSLDLQQ